MARASKVLHASAQGKMLAAGGAVLERENITLKVAAASDCKSVARAIVKYHEEGRDIEISAIGPQSVNVAVKAAAIAQEEFLRRGIDLTLQPRFETVHKEGEQLSALRFVVRIHPARESTAN